MFHSNVLFSPRKTFIPVECEALIRWNLIVSAELSGFPTKEGSSTLKVPKSTPLMLEGLHCVTVTPRLARFIRSERDRIN